MIYSELIAPHDGKVAVTIRRFKHLLKPEFVSFTIHNTTQEQTEHFIRTIIDSIGLSLFHDESWGYTSIEVRAYKGDGRFVKKGSYLSFRGLSPHETKEIIFKHLV